ncbi:putative phosphoesterase [Pustulibacterium marinum]|uniref:Putative phosphoesterase n=1 Tax=Pustulibacterium marinum TaxID=1224947 RepID=A0A1I7I6V3_9FLAO|nr:ligase-associated DNA damage response endonuclease PdeM [Pustulibacterium marinum]SFU68685.1 putative phosphoesterase [Pustulibacterium marinum]
MTETLRIQDQEFTLHPLGVAFWQNQNILLIADVHLGKTIHFRKHGIALPEASLYKNYENLDEVIEYFNPEQIYFLGDLFHSVHNREWYLFEEWVANQSAQITLIAGNHDIISDHYFEALGIEVLDELITDDFYFTHHPTTEPELFNICGHVHPGVKLKGPAKQTIKLSCFAQFEEQLILPAFGDFTGNFYIDQKTAEAIFICTEEEVILIN